LVPPDHSPRSVHMIFQAKKHALGNTVEW